MYLQALTEFVVFLLETAVIVIAILLILGGIGDMLSKGKDGKKGKLKVKNLNKKYQQQLQTLQEKLLTKKACKALKKQTKKYSKNKKDKRVFVLDFQGDIKASQVENLRREISAIIAIANKDDEVIVKLESPGGMVTGYGLAAAQLMRLREHHIPLTVCVDKVAASGGYMMACVADKILAAPFAIIGSVGVVAQLPNFHRFLQDKKIDFELVTAGEYKRTLTMFGENTESGREKFKQDLEDIHQQFKRFVAEQRPQLNIDQVATGEHWLADKALQLKLVDELKVSDDYLLEKSSQADLYHLYYFQPKGLMQKVAEGASLCSAKLLNRLQQHEQDQQHLN